MTWLIPFPDIGPDIFSIDLGGFSFALRWYALAYIAGIVLGWRMARRAILAPRLWPGEQPPMTSEHLEALLTWIILGIVLGGRLGFVLFYEPAYYLSNPAEIVKVWQGGMAFHGGLLGVAFAIILFCRINGLRLLGVADALALATPPGLLFGRIANFINNELWGRPTDMPWGVAFPGPAAQDCGQAVGEICARHPSQLYEALLEGLLLGAVILWGCWRAGWLKRPGLATGVFALGYGLARIFVEFFRLADAKFITPGNPYGHVVRLGEAGLTMGQVLSLPLVLLGAVLIGLALRRPL